MDSIKICAVSMFRKILLYLWWDGNNVACLLTDHFCGRSQWRTLITSETGSKKCRWKLYSTHTHTSYWHAAWETSGHFVNSVSRTLLFFSTQLRATQTLHHWWFVVGFSCTSNYCCVMNLLGRETILATPFRSRSTTSHKLLTFRIWTSESSRKWTHDSQRVEMWENYLVRDGWRREQKG